MIVKLAGYILSKQSLSPITRNFQKKKYLESLGLNVHVLWEVPLEKKGLSGSDIRESMLKGEPWEQLLPTAVVKLVKEWDIIKRISELSKKEF